MSQTISDDNSKTVHTLEDSSAPAKRRPGSPPGVRYGGRAKGTKNKATLMREQIIRDKLANFQADAKDPLSLFAAVYTDKDLPVEIRLDAGKAAAAYIHRKMPQAIEHAGTNNEPIKVKLIVEFVDAAPQPGAASPLASPSVEVVAPLLQAVAQVIESEEPHE